MQESTAACVVNRSLFLASPEPGTAVFAASFNLSLHLPHVLSMHGFMRRRDTVDGTWMRRSIDGGRTWDAESVWPTKFNSRFGVRRRSFHGLHLDPLTGRHIHFWCEGVLPTDNPLEGMQQWTIHYAVADTAETEPHVFEQIICEGFDERHPLPDVEIGRNAYMIGDFSERPITRSDGVILLPIQTTRPCSDGSLFKPANAYTFTDVVVLLGRWQPDGRIAWSASQRLQIDPARSVRGLIEPTIAELQDGSLLMVMRGSNGRQAELHSYRWMSRSFDGGQTWTSPQPWTYKNDEPFYSPSSCSQLVPHRNGRLFWVGNICEKGASGNGPRYPLLLGEVDRHSGCLLRRSLSVLDDRQPGESEHLTLSSFLVRQDHDSNDLLLHLTRLFASEKAPQPTDWTADALLYRIRLT